MAPTADSVTEKIDEMLKDDKTFSTRQGVRFMTSILKDALIVIADSVVSNKSFDTRLGKVETSLNEFLAAQKDKTKRDEEERSKWRWAFIAPTIGLIIAEIFRWIAR